jgi:hypothetical protein
MKIEIPSVRRKFLSPLVAAIMAGMDLVQMMMVRDNIMSQIGHQYTGKEECYELLL